MVWQIEITSCHCIWANYEHNNANLHSMQQGLVRKSKSSAICGSVAGKWNCSTKVNVFHLHISSYSTNWSSSTYLRMALMLEKRPVRIYWLTCSTLVCPISIIVTKRISLSTITTNRMTLTLRRCKRFWVRLSLNKHLQLVRKPISRCPRKLNCWPSELLVTRTPWSVIMKMVAVVFATETDVHQPEHCENGIMDPTSILFSLLKLIDRYSASFARTNAKKALSTDISTKIAKHLDDEWRTLTTHLHFKNMN